MKKIMNFFNYIEEKILIRYGRRIWQFTGFMALITLLISVILVIGNLLPTERRDVHVSKKEFIENKVDKDFDESNNVDACSKVDLKKAMDDLKKQMPLSEWVKLTTPKRVKRYKYVTRYDPWYGDYEESIPYYEMEETKNYDAVPTILEGIFSSKGIDSIEYCARIKVVETISALMKQTQKDAATKVLKDNFRYLIIRNDLQKKEVERSIGAYENVNGKKPFIVNTDSEEDPWVHFENYLYAYSNDSISENREAILKKVAADIKEIGLKNADDKNRFALWVLSNEMDDEGTEMACNDIFQSSIMKLNDENFMDQINKFIDLYLEKYHLAESLKEEEEFSKKANVEFFGSSGLASFGSILAIASILILYSIRQVLKDKKDE